VASLSQGRTAAAQCGLFTHKSVPVIFEPPCTFSFSYLIQYSLLGKQTLNLMLESKLIDGLRKCAANYRKVLLMTRAVFVLSQRSYKL